MSDERMPHPPESPGPGIEPPSPDVVAADEVSALPGVHRGGYLRLPTAPVAITRETAPAEPGTDEDVPLVSAQWVMPAPEPPHRGLAGWALAFSIAGLLVSLFVGWGFPIGLVGVGSAILALRRPLESRAVAVWALVVGTVSVLYSAGWLLYAAGRITTG
ncbi:hypothetical protein ACFQ0P_09485 [Microbacterium insulae]|uniref:DUF4190 domain-containing protein n=1 Tax=Microbacterium insulae TaxID=483014 RepID=A0ABW3AI83_9MICO